MMPMISNEAAPVPPPAYHRAQARLRPALHIDALTDGSTHCICSRCVAWQYAWPIADVLPLTEPRPGGAPRTYSEESRLIIALLRTLWRLSYQDMRDWLCDWPALALACGLPLGKDGHPRIPSPSQQCKRGKRAGAPLPEALFVLSILTAIRGRLIVARDLIIDSTPILAWRRANPDAADRACSGSASPSALARLSRPYPNLSRFWLATLLSALSRERSMMLPLLNGCWHGRCVCIRSVLASSA